MFKYVSSVNGEIEQRCEADCIAEACNKLGFENGDFIVHDETRANCGVCLIERVVEQAEAVQEETVSIIVDGELVGFTGQAAKVILDLQDELKNERAEDGYADACSTIGDGLTDLFNALGVDGDSYGDDAAEAYVIGRALSMLAEELKPLHIQPAEAGGLEIPGAANFLRFEKDSSSSWGCRIYLGDEQLAECNLETAQRWTRIINFGFPAPDEGSHTAEEYLACSILDCPKCTNFGAAPASRNADRC